MKMKIKFLVLLVMFVFLLPTVCANNSTNTSQTNMTGYSIGSTKIGWTNPNVNND